MRKSAIRNRALRAGLATLVASLVAFIPTAIQDLPGWFSPSSPPRTMVDLVLGVIVSFPITSSLFVVWLLPGCLVARWAMARRHVRGVGAALRAGLIVSVVACGALFTFMVVFEWPPSRAAWLSRIPAGIECMLFVVAWLVTFDVLSPPALLVGSEAVSIALAPATLVQRAGRTTANAFTLAAALAWTTITGSVGGAFMDFGGDGTYRLRSSVESPEKRTRACIVNYFSPGGALGHTYVEVYLLGVLEPWSAKHRGLLVWSSKHVDIVGVDWVSERLLRVRVRDDSTHALSRYAHAYPRDGFKVRTEIASAP